MATSLDKSKQIDMAGLALKIKDIDLSGNMTKSGTTANAGIETNTANTGTVGASTVVAAEYGDGVNHVTKLTLTAFAMGNGADNASLAIGNKIYTFPAGSILIKSATIVGGMTCALSSTAQTPELGIGTVIGSGAVATLTTTLEDIVDGGAAGLTGGDTVLTDVAGTAIYKGQTFTTGVLIKATGGKARDLFLNSAVAWADVTAAGACTFTGVITIEWALIS